MTDGTDGSAAATATGTAAPRPGSGGTGYRRTGIGLLALGAIAGGAAVAAPTAETRRLLVAFAGVGLFGGLLLYYVRPSATSDVDPAERVYAAFAASGAALRRDLSLADRAVYVPTDDDTEFAPVYLFVPDADLADETPGPGRRPVFGAERTARDAPIPDGAPGVTLYPTGAALFDDLDPSLLTDLDDEPMALAEQLVEVAVDGLELAGDLTPAVDAADGGATVTVSAPAFGPLTRFDHPVASLVAVGFALGLDTAVTTTVAADDHEAGTYRVTCRWDPAEVSETDGRAG